MSSDLFRMTLSFQTPGSIRANTSEAVLKNTWVDDPTMGEFMGIPKKTYKTL